MNSIISNSGDITKIPSQIRRDIVRMVHKAKSGHPGGSLGCVEYFTVLYFNLLRQKPIFNINGIDEDVFFLSNGHISPVWYSILARCGYFKIQELDTFRSINSRLQGHPSPYEGLPGIRIASGSLGQGLSVALGMAAGKKIQKDTHLVYVMLGDGEIQEGQIWEAAMFGCHHKVDNLIATIDCNGQQIDGPTQQVIKPLSLKAKWQAFGWHTIDCEDGNNLETVEKALIEAKNNVGKGKPIMILMQTIMGKGVDFMENDYKWHGIAPNDQQLSQALKQLEETLGDY